MEDNLAHSYNRRKSHVLHLEVTFPSDCRLIQCDLGRILTIDDLPDDVLLAIFDLYVFKCQDLHLLDVHQDKIESWQSLVHVCLRWRGLVFGSPRRLNLQLYYNPRRSAEKILGVWPALPLLISGCINPTMDNFITELEHSDRICQIDLFFYSTSQIEKLWTAMQVPFPELTVLRLSHFKYSSSSMPVLPDSILGGSAPRLRYVYLDGILFPGLPKLLMSATHLVKLYLHNIPHSGYISPEAMATCLSTLTSLETLQLEYESRQSSPDQENRRSPPPTRSILPALTAFGFKGVNEYLEELVAQINTPRLVQLWTTFFSDIYFDAPELLQFITQTFEAPKDVYVVLNSQTASVILQRQVPPVDVRVGISCREPDSQLSSVAPICTSFLPLLTTTENLYIHVQLRSELDWEDGIENTEWLELLDPFTAVKDLYLSKQSVPRIAPALQELTEEKTTEVLPTLQNLFLEGFQPRESVQEGIEQFISARQLTNLPVAISVWDRDLAQDESEVEKPEEVDDWLPASLAIIS